MNPFIDFTKWLLKWIAIIVVGTAAIVTLIIGGNWVWEWWSHERHVSKIVALVGNEAGGQRIIIDEPGFPVTTLCSHPDFPIYVGYLNLSSRTVEHIEIELSARLPGHSTDILSYGTLVKMDRIVEPNKEAGLCYKFGVREDYASNPKVNSAEYKAKIRRVEFQD